MQDVQTAAAIMGDRQRAISELSGAEGCAELHLPEGQVEGYVCLWGMCVCGGGVEG